MKALPIPGLDHPASLFRGIILASLLLLQSGSVGAALVGATDWVKVETASAEAAAQVGALGGNLIADYESFQLWSLAADQRAAVEDQPHITVRAGDDVIELHAGEVRTTPGATAALRTAGAAAETFTGQRLHLVQFAGPIKPEWFAALKNDGWRIVAHIPRNAYLVYGDAAALESLRSRQPQFPSIQWEGRYLPEQRLHPQAKAAQTKAQKAEATDDLFIVQLVEDAPANAETLQFFDQIKRAWVRQSSHLGYVNCLLRLPPERLAEVAERPDVVSIQPYVIPQKRDERQGQILAGHLTGNAPSSPGYLAWLTSKGFTAAQFATSNFAVDVTDSGIDNGTSVPGHFGLYTLGDKNLAARVAYNRLLGTPNSGSTIQACDGHGNLNSHIIAGYNDLSGFPHTDAEGYHFGLGICPYVRVGSSVIFDPDTFTFPNYTELQSRAYQDGARVSCNSWGANVGGTYTADCQMYDALVRDAQPSGVPFPAAGNQEMVIVFSAGNSGSSLNTIGAPGVAKNVITVGAAENVHSHSSANGGSTVNGADGCGITDTGADSANDIISFSSRGPCDDGRIKPDLVGPGTHVTGGVGQDANPGATGTALACFRASGVCSLSGGGSLGNPNNFFPLGQQFYTTSSGTSHSCPAIGGGVALLRQYFLNHGWAAPSPAMSKAWLLNSTRYLTGLSANDTLPSNHQGFGSMNLGLAFDDVPRTRRDQLAEDRFTATGQTRTFEGFVFDPSQPLRITLAWTDAPGSTTGNAYNNNLDLTLSLGGQTYRGNVFSGSNSIAGGVADVRNNVESIFLPPGQTGPFTLTITAANINSDGVPNNADLLDQDFALVIYNATDRDVIPTPAGATLSAESCPPGQGAVDPGEVVTFEFALQNLGPSNTTALVATLLPTGGVLAPSAPQNYGVLTGNAGPAVSRAFTFQAGGACGSVLTCTLQLQDGTNDYGSVEFPLPLGLMITNSVQLTNATPISIGATDGLVTPYPATTMVSGLGGTIQTVTVTLNGLSHSWPDDLDILLVSPSGHAVKLLSDAGGEQAVSGLNLTFADSSPNLITDAGALTSGVWRPADFEASDSFASPAPSGPAGAALAAFAGTDPNGAWRLFIADDYSSDDGGSLASWTLNLTVTNSLCCVDPNSADLEVQLHDAPDPITISNTVVYTITVTNHGPAAATGIFVTNRISDHATVTGTAVSQGTSQQIGNLVIGSLGALPAGGSASLFISATVNSGPQLDTTATVTAAVPDHNPLNNFAPATTTVIVPSVAIQDTTVIEGDSETSYAVFVVALAQPTAQPVQVDWFTTDGTAQAGADYLAQSNQVTFLPGEIVQTIVIPVLPDLLDEANETLRVVLTNAVNVTVVDLEAVGTIMDDDPMPAISISDTAVVEGQAGVTNALALVSLSAPSGRPVSIALALSNGTALAGSDYQPPQFTQLTLPPGTTTTNATLPVNGDTVVELDETFLVQLVNPTNAVLGAATGTVTILTDDFAPLVRAVGYRFLSEVGGVTNGSFDPGETITLSLALINLGSAPTTNLVATLQPNLGVGSPSGPQSYGVLAVGGLQISRPFTFTVGLSNCGALNLNFTFADGGTALGQTNFAVIVGNCFADDFEPGIDLMQWSAFGGTVGSTVLATNFGGSVSPVNSLWFGGDNTRFAATRSIDVSGGGTISFNLRLSSGTTSGQWESVDLPGEGVVLEYSINEGGSWVVMGSFTDSTYFNWTPVALAIPEAAQTEATRFRWRQLSHSGSCCDHWAIDDVLVVTGPQPPTIQGQPANQTVITGSAAAVAVIAAGSSPLRYQWWFNNAPLATLTATNATLLLTDVTTNHAGNYFVVITNNYGAITSSVAIVTVVPGISLAEAVDTSGLVWTSGGTTNWLGQTTFTHDGADAAQSGLISHSQQTWMQTTVTGPGTLTFWWRVSSESCCDYHAFAVDGVQTFYIAGEITWQQRTVNIAAGSHTLRWTYSKDGSVNTGSDRAWVDQVSFQPSFGSLHHFVWNSISATQTVGVAFPITIAAQDAFNNPATNFTGNANLSAWAASGAMTTSTILSNVPYQSISSGSYTLGYSFTPNALLTVTHVRHFFGTKVSIWTDGGTLLAAQNVSSVAGVWTETALTTPVQLTPGTRYRVGVYTGGSSYYWRSDQGSTFNHGTIDQGYDSSGDTFPVLSDSTRWWFVDLRYQTEAATTLPATPVTVGPFVNGNWSGAATVLTPATNVTLRVDDGAGHADVSNPFVVAVATNTPPFIYLQPTNQTVFSGSTAIFGVSAYGSLPLDYQWCWHGTNLPGHTTATLVLPNVQTNHAGPYSVVITNAFGAITSAVAQLTVPPGGSGIAYLRSVNSLPWGVTTNEGCLNRVFGTNWQDLRFETVAANTLFSSANGFIFMEGSDTGATELETFLTSNYSLMEAWVAAGGHLFLNAAPNEDNGMYFGFGVNLINADSAANVSAAAPSHPIVTGPFTPTGTNWSGISFAHASVSGTNLIALLTNTANGHIVLAERAHGAGRVLFGGMTTPNFHSPGTEAGNLRANILSYGASAVIESNTAPQITTQPASVTVRTNATAELNVVATGSEPLHYQWRFYSTNLLYATNSSLTLANIQSPQAGPYSVVITNAAGAITSAVATVTVIASEFNALIIWDIMSPGTLALSNALAAAGGNVTLSATAESSYTGSNPSPAGQQVVIHLNGTTYDTDMPLAGQAALSNFVASGGGYVCGEWNSYEVSQNWLVLLREVNLLDRTSGATGPLTLTVEPEQATHPILEQIPNSFSFTAGYNIGPEHSFPTNPVVVLARDQSSNPAIAVRSVAAGRAVHFHFAPNYHELTLSNATVIQLYVNAARFAGRVTGLPPTITAQPTNLTVTAGAVAALHVTASGTTPLACQWQHYGTNIPAATNLALAWSHIPLSAAGPYRVSLTNAFGQTSSSNAWLTVLPAPLPPLLRGSMQSNLFFITFNSTPGLEYAVDYRNQLGLGPWNVLTNLVATDTNTTCADHINSPQRFYRVRELGTPAETIHLTGHPLGSQFILAFNARTGRSYTVEYAFSHPGVWWPLTNLVAPGTNVIIFDPITWTQRFYRVVTPGP